MVFHRAEQFDFETIVAIENSKVDSHLNHIKIRIASVLLMAIKEIENT